MIRKPSKQVLVIVVVAEMISAVGAWRDLSRRAESQVRGKRAFWRAVILANPGNSLLYWLLGRRRTEA